MRLTKNFKLREFIESKFYDDDTQAKVWQSFNDNKDELLPNIQKLANNLQVLRDYLDKPVKINIAYRPKWYEISKGRSGNSQHVLGKAADIVVKDVKPYLIAEIIESLISDGEMLQGGLGRYDSFTHTDIRKTRARWGF
jgi:uncharacterized protein YcbK (DUF882 family)